MNPMAAAIVATDLIAKSRASSMASTPVKSVLEPKRNPTPAEIAADLIAKSRASSMASTPVKSVLEPKRNPTPAEIAAELLKKSRVESNHSIETNMNKFTIDENGYLRQNIQGFYYSGYNGGDNWKIDGKIENIITTFKNDIPPYKNKETLQLAVSRLKPILEDNLQKISRAIDSRNITVCVVPRAKVYYEQNQLLFKNTVKEVITNLNGFIDGTDFITRQHDTKTTHRNNAGHGGNGDMPYPGITKKTCDISNDVKGKDILLIDDVYTKSINIDEDVIQALLDCGAKSVIFYAVGKTQ